MSSRFFPQLKSTPESLEQEATESTEDRLILHLCYLRGLLFKIGKNAAWSEKCSFAGRLDWRSHAT